MNAVKYMTPTTAEEAPHTPWEPFLVTKEEIDLEIERLLDEDKSKTGFRAASIVHPRVNDGIPSFTPVTEICLNVLKPGERTPARRGNYSLLETAVSGTGRIHAGTTMTVTTRDVWTVPPMQDYWHENTGDEPWVWLSYSNTALLRRTGTYWAEADPTPRVPEGADPTLVDLTNRFNRNTAPIHDLPSTGAELRAYEYLTDIHPVPNPPLHWVWDDMEPHLPLQRGDNNDPSKRQIWLLYNPATERRQGTTQTHFATYAGTPPGTPPYQGKRGHFHTSASVNYHVAGHGYSIVGGDRVDWKAGDLLLSAPSWVEHAHYIGDDGCVILTVQDHPLHISMGSLLWQEDVNQPIYSLGNEEGQKGYVHPRQKGA